MSNEVEYWRDRCNAAETKAETLQEALDSTKLDLQEANKDRVFLRSYVSRLCSRLEELVKDFREEPKERSEA